MNSSATCAKCADDYYLTEKLTCAKKPALGITGCRAYRDLLTCAVCSDGYLEKEGSCLNVSGEKENCKSYRWGGG